MPVRTEYPGDFLATATSASSSLSCYTHGLMEDDTSTIGLPSRFGLIPTSSCTAGVFVFIRPKRLPHRPLEWCPVGMSYNSFRAMPRGSSARTTSAISNGMLPTPTDSTNSSGTLSPRAKKIPEELRLSVNEGVSEVLRDFGPRGVIHSWQPRKTTQPWNIAGPRRSRRGSRFRAHYSTQAHGDLRRRVRRRRFGFHQAAAQRAGSHSSSGSNSPTMHDLHHSKTVGASARLADRNRPYHGNDTVIDHDKNVGQMLEVSRVRHRPWSNHLFVMYSTTTALIAIRGRTADDAFRARRTPTGEGRSASRSYWHVGLGKSRRINRQRHRRASELVPDVPGHGRRPDVVEKLKMRLSGDRPDLQDHIDGIQSRLPHRRNQGVSPQLLLLLQ